MAKREFIEECGSTNQVVADKDMYGHGDAVAAVRQTEGRGQRGHKWTSEPGENLTFSMVLEPTFLEAAEQFLLSEVIALGVSDMLNSHGIDARIKWTNDIYVGDKKICGMLIENELRDGNLSRSIAGIGINVNQIAFPDWVPNPCSMATVTGRTFDVEDIFETVYEKIMIRYAMLEQGEREMIEKDYHDHLYRLDESHIFMIPAEGEVQGIIRSVEPTGRLQVEINGEIRGFLFREIEFVL